MARKQHDMAKGQERLNVTSLFRTPRLRKHAILAVITW